MQVQVWRQCTSIMFSFTEPNSTLDCTLATWWFQWKRKQSLVCQYGLGPVGGGLGPGKSPDDDFMLRCHVIVSLCGNCFLYWIVLYLKYLPLSPEDSDAGLGACGWILVIVSFFFTVLTFPISIWMCIKVKLFIGGLELDIKQCRMCPAGYRCCSIDFPKPQMIMTAHHSLITAA